MKEQNYLDHLVGVFGQPVAENPGVIIQDAAFAAMGLERWHFLTLDVDKDQLENAINGLKAFKMRGINCTIPHKIAVMQYLDEISESAQLIGAVNTIVNRGGELWGYNTDFAGMETLLRSNRIALSGRKVLILGSGGTCKTARAVAKDLGAKEILIASRHPSDGQISYEQALKQKDVQVIFNTTPLGMYPNLDAQAIDLSAFPALEAVVDVIYNPLRTKLLLQAQEMGIPCRNGLEMLVAQAKYAAELFLDREIPDSEISRVHRKLCVQMENIALIGMPSSGKTTTAKMLAARMGREYVDLDELIAKNAGMSIPMIFQLKGEAYFRQLEKDALRSVCGRQGLILSPGGGIVKDEDNIRLMRHNSRIVFLDRDLDRLAKADPSRPLSASAQAVQKMYEERLPLYRKYSDFTIDNNGAQKETVRRIEEKIHETACH